MARIAIVTDSTADLPPEVAERHGVTVVPLTVQIGGKSYRDRVDLSIDEFMRLLPTADPPPTTSQPTPAAFERAYRLLLRDHDAIVSIHIAASLSGTAQSARLAAETVSGSGHVAVVDSRNASMGLGLQAIRAAALASRGDLGADEIAARLSAEAGRYEVIFMVETLEYLRRGGRIGRASALLGTLLDVKPILRLADGEIMPQERTRTRKRAIAGVVDHVRGLSDVASVAVIYNTTPDDADKLKHEFDLLVPGERSFVTALGPVVGTHVGPGVLGVAVQRGNFEDV